MNLKAYF